MFNFIDMVQQHQTGMHLDVFREDVLIQTSAGRTIEATGIIKVTEQAEQTDNGIGVIVRAELIIPSTLDCGDDIGIHSTWTLTFRGQQFAIESLSPPVAGFIKINALNLSRELTHSPALNPR